MNARFLFRSYTTIPTVGMKWQRSCRLEIDAQRTWESHSRVLIDVSTLERIQNPSLHDSRLRLCLWTRLRSNDASHIHDTVTRSRTGLCRAGRWMVHERSYGTVIFGILAAVSIVRTHRTWVLGIAFALPSSTC